MAKEKTATEQLNLSLSGLESALVVMQSVAPEDGPLPDMIKTARERATEVRDHLLTIQFHLAQLR